jgi:hypothetical protein
MKNEARDLVREDVHLDHELDRNALGTQRDELVEDPLPGWISGKVVVGEEVEVHSRLPIVQADRFRHTRWRSSSTPASLHVNDGAERAVEGTSTTASDGAEVGGDELAEVALVDEGARSIGEIREIIDEPINGLEATLSGVTKQVRPAVFDLAGDDAHAGVNEILNLRRNLGEQREGAAHVEAADEDGHSFAPQRQSDVRRTTELVRLHSDE